MNKAEEYLLLKKQEKTLRERLAKLRTDLIGEQFEDFDHLKVVVTHRTKQNVDNLAAEQLLREKGLWYKACKEVVDYDKIEELWLNEELTDDDLRQIDAGRQYIPVLSVVDKEYEEVIETDVQGNDESPGQ